MAQRLQVPPETLMVVNFSIENERLGAISRGHWLPTIADVQNTQPAHAQSHPRGDEEALVIWTAVSNGPRHPAHQKRKPLRIGGVTRDKACYAAHNQCSLVQGSVRRIASSNQMQSIRLQIAVGLVPIGGQLESFLYSDLWLVTEITFGFGNTKGADLSKPVHATPEQRRRNSKRITNSFACYCRRVQRPEGVMSDLDIHAHGSTDVLNEVVQRVIMLIGGNVCFSFWPLLRGEKKTVHEIFDVNRMIERLTSSEHHEGPVLTTAVHHKKARWIPGAVNRGRPDDGCVKTRPPDDFVDDLLALVFSILVIVLRPDR